MLVVCLNGTINAGKSTVGRLLASRLGGAEFVDGDDHDAPADAPLAERIERGMERLVGKIEGATARVLILANPLDDDGYNRLLAAARSRDAKLTVVTLAPPLSVVLADRGTRQLSEGERARIVEMFAEGYHERVFSDLVLADPLTPEELADRIAAEPGVVG